MIPLGRVAPHARGLHGVQPEPVHQPGELAVAEERVASQVTLEERERTDDKSVLEPVVAWPLDVYLLVIGAEINGVF